MSEEKKAVQFIPVRGLDAKIASTDVNPIIDGCVYFATDSGKIYVDSQGKRVVMGAAGAAIYYGSIEKPEDVEGFYHLPVSKISGTPKIGDLILNVDGGFYKVERIDEAAYVCTQVSVSGTGDGPGPSISRRPSCSVDLANRNFINGQPATFHITAEAAKDANGNPVTAVLNVYYELYTADGVRYHQHPAITIDTREEDHEDGLGRIDTDIDFHADLQPSRTSKLKVWVEASNHDIPQSYVQEFTISSSELVLYNKSGWKPSTHYPTSGFDIECTVVGSINKIVEFYYDDMNEPADTKYVSAAEANIAFSVSGAVHGYHTVSIRLYQNLGTEAKPKKGFETTPLKYEIAVVDTGNASAKPIIWLGDYQDVYYTYDSIQIPYLVYDPANTSVTKIHLYKDKVEIQGGERDIYPSDNYNYWEIADAEMGRLNSYQISCGETDARRVEREITFRVQEDPIRTDFAPVSDNLLLNFNATGRSNDEAPAKRKQWSYELKTNKSDADGTGVIKHAIFENFTWTDKNGWTVDPETKQTRLTISNGARFTIPFKSMEFGKGTAGKESHTVEMQIRVRNIQKYGNLIANITRYENDTEHYNAFIKQTKYDNYDAYLQANLDPEAYENLKFVKVQKDIQINNVVGGLYHYDESSQTATGFCVGTQDAFFSNGQDTVNVNFVEDEMVNLSFVYQHGLKLMYIYINGIITGVIRSYDGAEGTDDDFTINNTNIVFDSQFCDIDLYKLRIYNTDLNVNQIVLNYAADTKDVATYDQSKIYKFATLNQALQEYQIDYNAIVEYNSLNPANPTMPYIIFDIGTGSLPYSKDDKKKIKVEFINAPLEAAYASGELETLARADGLIPSGANVSAEQIEAGIRTYYKHHCPSWISTLPSRQTDLVNFEVQGTSSEFYPRRNYKIKTKMDGNFNWSEEKQKFEDKDGLNIFMHKGPFTELFDLDDADASVDYDGKFAGKERTRMSKGWYMNNYTNPTDRWTMKVDYMESSGSYNAGFASLVGNAYTKHPLQDYLKDYNSNLEEDLFTNTDKLKPVITSAKYTAIQWKDYRTSLLGFPVMAFQKSGKKYTFLGYYRMLLDKSSTQVLGFKPDKSITHKLFPIKNENGEVTGYERVRDIAECWEFSNNARGFCSFRDPWNRVELSFLSPRGEKNEWTKDGAPVVANNFEYRYHCKDDYIDKLYKFDEQDQATLNTVAEKLGLPANSIEAGNRYDGANALMTTHRNWEKVVKWVWSTNLDVVASQGTYNYVLVSDTEYKDDFYFKVDETGESASGFVKAVGPFDPSIAYYKYSQRKNEKNEMEDVYSPIRLCLPENLYTNPAKQWYYQVAGQNTPDDASDDVYALATEAFDNQTDYYEFISDTEAIMDTKLDRLVRPVDISTESFNPATTYYLWDGSVKTSYGKPTGAVTKVTAPTEEEFAAGKYYVANPTTYGKNTYTHDSREYRAAKFTNEFPLHFDPEYVATYFVMTEAMELYDSRGKNCMMASWGPHKAGGNYIWYPIFYDIDTQLGINNTGIPSFQFNVDATDAGNFSTSDSILWNNFYKFFKTIWMVPKYRNLRGSDSKFAKLEEVTDEGVVKTAPLQSVDYIEKWYAFDEEVTHNIACRGIRPKLATNLDMFFKYITICNAAAKDQGVAHLGGEGSNGAPADADSGTYFYALQGDRSQSRQQFVESRLDYIDSWLGQGNYARAGQNRLWGRISANNRSDKDSAKVDVHSDKWTETAQKPYWKNDVEFGEKTHEFDAEYWLEPTPIRSSYFTAGDDSANYPSAKYDGVHKLQFKLAELENGIRRSDHYPEQLLYIYGTDKMSDFGDLSKMYWTEFKIEGNANKLTRLKLGHDGTTFDYPSDTATEKENITWYNKKLNNITLPTAGLPLLKEANFCNITLTANKPLDLSKSDKLENFRATGSSGITGVTFAKGVALNTLYLPSNIGTLSLDGAELLTKLIGYTDKNGNIVEEHKYTIPEMENGDLVAKPGLYLEGFFDTNGSSSLKNLSLKKDALGYNSYRLLKRLYDKYNGTNGKATITMTDVKWCPYTLLGEGDIYDATKSYYIDNGHYGFAPYTNIGSEHSKAQFDIDVLSGKLYCDNRENAEFNDDVLYIDGSAITVLKSLYENITNFGGSTADHPEITGIIYIHNDGAEIEETVIANTLQKYYPNLTFFFKEVEQAYSATFVLIDKDTGASNWVGYQTADGYGPSVQKISKSDMTLENEKYFSNPYALYKVKREHWDFYGWSTSPDENNAAAIISKPNPELSEEQQATAHAQAWKASKAKVFTDVNQVDYPFYAILTEHTYTATFKDFFNPSYEQYARVKYSDRGAFMHDNVPAPVNHGASELYKRNTFKGWTNDIEKAKIIYGENVADEDLPLINVSDYPATRDYEFYAVYKKESVFNQVVSSDYFIFTNYSYTDVDNGSYSASGCKIELNNDYRNAGYLSGKITLPVKDPKTGKPVVAIGNIADNGITHIFFDKKNANEIRYIDASAFGSCEQLVYFDFEGIPNLRYISDNAFNNCRNFNTWTFYDPLYYIGEYAFASAGENISERVNLTLNPMLKVIRKGCFRYGAKFGTIEVGNSTSASQMMPSDWLELDAGGYMQSAIMHSDGYRPLQLYVYYPDSVAENNWRTWLSMTPSPYFEMQEGNVEYVKV